MSTAAEIMKEKLGYESDHISESNVVGGGSSNWPETQQEAGSEDSNQETGGHDVGRNDGKSEELIKLESVKDDPELLQAIKEAAEQIIQIEKEVKALGENKKAIREKIVAKGINRHSFAAAIARFKLEETDRKERELAYQVCCKALEVEHQLDLL